jgi:hypothetical protein
MGGWLFIIFVAGPALGTIFYKMFSGVKSIANGPAPLPEWEMPAGRIHLFDGDRYLDSSPGNPYEHVLLNWANGKIGCVMSDELARNPHYQPALIGTIQILKPENERGLVAVILDNQIAASHGLEPVGLNGDAQLLVERIVPEATLRTC